MALISSSAFLKVKVNTRETSEPKTLISQFENKEHVDPIVVKKDFIKKIGENTETNTVLVRFTIYYNVINLIYGFDTLLMLNNDELEEENQEEKRKFSKVINLYKSLSSSEVEILEYFKKILKIPSILQENIKALPRTVLEVEAPLETALENVPNLESAIARIDPRTQNDPRTPIGRNNGFPKNLYIDDNTSTLYLYSNLVQSNNISDRKVSANSSLRNITSRAYRKIYGKVAGEQEPFRNACFNAIQNRKDPALVFEKACFLKSYKSQEGYNDLDFIDKEILSSFIFEIEAFPPGVVMQNVAEEIIDDDPDHYENYSYSSSASNLSYNIETHNYKKLEFTAIVSSENGNSGFEFSIYLAKSSDKMLNNKYTLYNQVDASALYSDLKDSLDYNASAKQGLSGFTPTFIGEKSKRPHHESGYVFLPLTSVESEEIKAYYSSRVVSKDKNANSGYLNQLISRRSSTSVSKVITAGNSISRMTTLNDRTGEVLFESDIFSATAYKDPRSYTPSYLLQILDSVQLYVTTVNHPSSEEGGDSLSNQPINKIIIKNLPSQYEVYKFFRKYEFQSGKQELPVSLSDTILNDISPIPNEKVKYFIRVRDRSGSEYIGENHDLVVYHRTYPAGGLDISISQGQIQNPSVDSYHIPVTVSVQNENIIQSLKNGIEKIFTNRQDAEFYDDVLKEKVNSKIEKIGDFFRLYVNEYDVFDSDEDKSYYLEPVERGDDEGQNSEINVSLFTINVDTSNTNKIIHYNLVRKNMHDVLDLVESVVEDADSKKMFRRRTSAFFNSLSLSSGILPVQKKVNAENSKYVFNSRMGNSDFQFISCLGGSVELGQNLPPSKVSIDPINLEQIHSTGEFIISWTVSETEFGAAVPRAPEFFVITVVINNYEIVIGAHPSIGYEDYKYRTQTFLDVAGAVKFRVYPVYNDFRIEKDDVFETEELQVSDIKSFNDSIQVN